MTIRRILLALALACLPLAHALAGAGTITTKDAAGVTRAFVVTTDGTGNFVSQTVICDATAAATCAAVGAAGLKVDGSGATQPVSGTVTATVTGVATAANQASVIGTKAPGTAATNSSLLGAIYTAAGISLSDGQQAALQFDSTGNLKVSGVGVAQGSTTSGQTLSLVGAAAATAAPTTTAGNTYPLSMDVLGGLRTSTLNNGVGATGAAPPANANYIGALGSGATGGLLAPMVQCDSRAIYDASTNGSTELVALTSGRSVYVCGYSIMAGGTVNVKLIYGTGTACATGSNNLTPAWQLTAQAGIAEASPFYRGMKTASANALCINTSAGVAAQAIVYYSVI